MAKLIIVYGTGEGQTKKIAERIAETGRRHGHIVDVMNGRSVPATFSPDGYDAVVVGASIHMGRYPGYILDFVKTHLAYLNRTPSAFFTVCLTAAQPDEESKRTVKEYVAQFEQAAGWQPAKVGTFAGALKYREYWFVQRFVMKMIARQMDQPTDTSRD